MLTTKPGRLAAATIDHGSVAKLVDGPGLLIPRDMRPAVSSNLTRSTTSTPEPAAIAGFGRCFDGLP
jgi:hypothetical protein